jgi:hypothetical protein
MLAVNTLTCQFEMMKVRTHSKCRFAIVIELTPFNLAC